MVIAAEKFISIQKKYFKMQNLKLSSTSSQFKFLVLTLTFSNVPNTKPSEDGCCNRGFIEGDNDWKYIQWNHLMSLVQNYKTLIVWHSDYFEFDFYRKNAALF